MSNLTVSMTERVGASPGLAMGSGETDWGSSVGDRLSEEGSWRGSIVEEEEASLRKSCVGDGR